MRTLPEHGVFEIQEHGDSKAAAYLRIGESGVSVSIHGHGVRSQDHVIFSISQEDATEISELSDTLKAAAEVAERVGERKREERLAEYTAEYGADRAEVLTRLDRPVVRRFAEGLFPHRWELRGGVVEDDDIVLGGLSWLRDRLDL